MSHQVHGGVPFASIARQQRANGQHVSLLQMARPGIGELPLGHRVLPAVAQSLGQRQPRSHIVGQQLHGATCRMEGRLAARDRREREQRGGQGGRALAEIG